MSTNLAISLAAQAQANAAQAAAAAAHKTACMAFIEGYQHSIERMHEYASCVNLLYPSAGDDFWLKVAVGAMLLSIPLGAAAGAFFGGKYDSLDHKMLGGAVAGFVGTFVGACVLGGLAWVVS